MHEIFSYSDLIGGFLGIFGSLVLAYPYFSEITDRRQWELLLEFRRLAVDPEADSATQDAYRAIRDQMIDDRLGQHLQYRWVTLVGLLLLFGAFVFTTVASFLRWFGG